jgi:hypothetical protein
MHRRRLAWAQNMIEAYQTLLHDDAEGAAAASKRLKELP